VSKHGISTKLFEYTLKRHTFQNFASLSAVVYVFLGRAVTQYRWGGIW